MRAIKLCLRDLIVFILLSAALVLLNTVAFIPWPILQCAWLLLYPLTAATVSYQYGKHRHRRGGGFLLAIAFCFISLVPMALFHLPCTYLFWSWPSLLLLAVFAIIGEAMGRTSPPKALPPEEGEEDGESRIFDDDGEAAIYDEPRNLSQN